MNIKSLLLGSAAALVAVSGARAADAVVVAEPEPMEYVRICDTYGVGFYYIPGSETCIKFSGLIRYDIDFRQADDGILIDVPATPGTPAVLRPVVDAGGVPVPGLFTEVSPAVPGTPAGTRLLIRDTGLEDGWAKNAVARLNVDVRSETEFGTFQRFMRIEGGVGGLGVGSDIALPNSGGVNVIYAYMQLGGLLVGFTDTLFDGDMGLEFDVSGGNRTHQIRYTFDAGNGITVAASIEENDYNLDYTPNVVGMFGITQGWGNVRAFAAYDATAEEFALKAVAAINASDAITIEAMAQYESDPSMFSINDFPAGYGITGYEFTVGAGVNFKATDKLSVGIGAQGFFNEHVTSADDYKIGGQIQYNIVENLTARVTANYNGGDTFDFWDGKFRLDAAF